MVAGRKFDIRLLWQQHAVDTRGPHCPAHCSYNSGRHRRRQCERGREKVRLLRNGNEIGRVVSRELRSCSPKVAQVLACPRMKPRQCRAPGFTRRCTDEAFDGSMVLTGPRHRISILTTLENGRKAIWTVHPDGSQQHKVIEEDGLASPRWSPAGDGIYVLHSSQGNTQELLKVAINPKSGRPKDPASVLLSGLQTGNYFTVSTDGTRLAYSRSQHYSNLWLAQVREGVGQRVTNNPLTRGTSRFDSPSISPDGKWIAFVNEGHIYKMPMEGGTSVQLTFSNATDASPAWSPDGERIAFGSNEGGSHKVWIVDADGANRRQFAQTRLSESDNLGAITWSPGRHILYQKPGNRNFNILNPETEEEKPLLQNESSAIRSPEVFTRWQEGRRFWNRSPQDGLWVISLIDNTETFLGRGCFPSGVVAGWKFDIRLLRQQHAVDTCPPRWRPARRSYNTRR